MKLTLLPLLLMMVSCLPMVGAQVVPVLSTSGSGKQSLQRSPIVEQACPICYVEYDVDNVLLKRTLPCSHQFHESCIAKWLHIKNSCPMCKVPVQAPREPAREVTLTEARQLLIREARQLLARIDVAIENAQTEQEMAELQVMRIDLQQVIADHEPSRTGFLKTYTRLRMALLLLGTIPNLQILYYLGKCYWSKDATVNKPAAVAHFINDLLFQYTIRRAFPADPSNIPNNTIDGIKHILPLCISIVATFAIKRIMGPMIKTASLAVSH